MCPSGLSTSPPLHASLLFLGESIPSLLNPNSQPTTNFITFFNFYFFYFLTRPLLFPFHPIPAPEYPIFQLHLPPPSPFLPRTNVDSPQSSQSVPLYQLKIPIIINNSFPAMVTQIPDSLKISFLFVLTFEEKKMLSWESRINEDGRKMILILVGS